jgi:PAS domain S-box-containing protein
MLFMRVRLPQLRRLIPPASAPALRYFVALLSTTLALIPALLLKDLVESRLVVFSVAVMVSAWYGGWKPGLVATSFALTVSAYFSLTSAHSSGEFRNALLHLSLFVLVAFLICWFNAALRSAQDGLLRSEMNFRSLVTNAPYGICRISTDGTILDVNPALVALLGYSHHSELTRRKMASLYKDVQQANVLASFFRTLKEFDGLVVEWARKDGSSTVIRLCGRAIRDEDDAVSFEMFAEDVTERRALEQQLRQAQKMEAIGRLAGGIAHDFNNLLMVISGYCEFLLERLGPDESLRGPAREIANAADRATSLTRQLLAFSRKQMLAPKVLDLNAVVTENLRMLTRLIGEDVELVMVPGAENAAVKCDPGQIEQVILNLAVNARDAMPHGGKMTIETAEVSLDETYARYHPSVNPGNYVMLAITDTGHGMDAETQSHLFEPFFTTKGTKGTGLGLSTVYGIVKQSGGYIWVYSEINKGTTFKIYMPRVSEAMEAMPANASAVPVMPLRGIDTILLVEDEANLRELTAQYLQNQGYTVLEAADGAAAIKICTGYTGPIHLLLTDVIMPGMNGRELAQRVSTIRPGTKVLYMSGYTENVIGHDGTLAAGISLLQKPFTLQALNRKVREVLDSEVIPQEVSMAARPQEVHAPRGKKLPPFRAQRFNLQLPLRYRPIGENEWRQGTTENISRSGLLFRAQEPLQPMAQLEINLVLPVEIGGLSATEVFCKGEVVRNVQTGGTAVSPALAAKILQYHFHHGSHVSEA